MRDLRERVPARLDHFSREGEVVRGVLHGELPGKSNSRRIFKFRGQARSIKSQEALDFVERVKLVASYSRFGAALVGATSMKTMKQGLRLLYLKAFVYGASFDRDLDCELLPDALQHAGVINNDRAIRQKFYWWDLDTANPRVVFEIGYVNPGEARGVIG